MGTGREAAGEDTGGEGRVSFGEERAEEQGMNKMKLKIMVASSVYHFETELTQICAILKSYGYEILNSHLGTMPVHPNKSNLDNCLCAVENCDLFLGIIRPFYGSGIVRNKSITHHEISKAIELEKPRWFLVHCFVPFSGQLLKQYMYRGKKRKNMTFKFKKTDVMDDVRVIDMYNEAIKNDLPVEERTGNWSQAYYDMDDIKRYLEWQFKDKNRIRKIVDDMKRKRR